MKRLEKEESLYRQIAKGNQIWECAAMTKGWRVGQDWTPRLYCVEMRRTGKSCRMCGSNGKVEEDEDERARYRDDSCIEKYVG